VVVIVERKPLPHLSGRIPHNRIGVGVIVRRPVKDLDPESTFLQKIGLAG
jgi:hypothetical protein